VAANDKSGATQRKIHAFEAGNALAASIILSDTTRYQGLMEQWAELWVERHGAVPKPAFKAERTREAKTA
jgi:hypothetical protein